MHKRPKNESIRKIQKSGKKSYYVTLPMGAMREFHWREHQKVVIETDRRRKRFVIRDWKKK